MIGCGGTRSAWIATWAAVALGLLLSGSSFAAGARNDVLHCVRVKAVPRIDGDLGDACWAKAGTALDLLELSATKTVKVGKQTVVYAAWDDEALYLAARCEEGQPEKIVRDANNDAWRNDCVEFFVALPGASFFYQFSVDTVADNVYDAKAGDGEFRSGARSASRVGKSAWTVEAAIPFAALGGPPKQGDVWRVNLGREDRVSHALSIWAPAEQFQDMARFGRMAFVSAAGGDQRTASHVGLFDDVVTNPDLSPGPGGGTVPAGWTISGKGAGVHEITFQSQKWELVSRSGAGQVASQDLRLRAGRSYTLTARARGQGGAGVGVVVREGDGEKRLIWTGAKPGFHEYKARFVAAGGNGRVLLHNTTGKGLLGFDRVSIKASRPYAVVGLGLPGYDMPATDPIVTDHLKWAKPLAGGPVRTLFTMSRTYAGARDFVELAQRVELDYDIVLDGTASATPGQVGERFAGDGYDVFVVSTTRRFPDELRDLIRERVRSGRGLVVVENVVCWASVVLGNQKLEAAEEGHFVRRDLPWEELPDILSGIDVGAFGKGRVVVLRFDRSKSYFYNMWPTERGQPRYVSREHRFWEGWHALMGRAIAWAAGRDTDARVTCTVEGRTVSARLQSGDPNLRLKVRVRSGRELRFDGTMLPSIEASAEREVRVALPEGFPDGALLVDGQVQDGQGRLTYWSSTRLETPQVARIESCTASKESYAGGEEVAVDVKLMAQEPCRGVLRTCVLDAWKRKVWEKAMPVELAAGRQTTVSVAVDVSRTLSTSNRVFVTFVVDGREADSAWTYVYLPHVTRDIVRSDWHTTSWGAGWSSWPVYRHYCDMLRTIGINDQMGGYGCVENGMAGGRCEAPPRHTFDSYVTGGERDRSNVRKPCLSDPATRKRMEDQSREYAASVQKWGLDGVYVAGEAMLCSGGFGVHDVCLGPHCEARYQQWLEKQYGAIDKLNAEWETDYKSFAECRGMKTADARKRSNFAPFVDFREFMADVWVGAFRYTSEAYAQGDAGLRVGHTHCFGAVTLGGTDFYRLARYGRLGWGQEYPECKKPEARYASFMAWRSFSPRDWPNLSWIGYSHTRQAIEYEPWWLALHGSRGVSWHQVNAVSKGRSYAVVFPTLAHTQASYWIRDSQKDLMEGVGKVFMEFEPHAPRIGILWSYPSLSVAWCESDLDYWQASEGPNDKAYGTWYKSAFNFRLLCEDLQLDYRYVAPEQILTEDALKRFDLVFLPETIAASPELIERLRRFVRAGGTVVGDFRCLRTNEHGKLYAMDKQPLEELFGVRRLGEAATYGARSVSFVRKHRRIALNGRAMPGTCAEAVTTGAGAVALAEHADGTPAVVVRESGKGRTVYLNLVLPRYNVTARELLRQTVAWAGVPRGVRVTGRDRDKPPRAYQVNRFTSGGNEVVGVIRDYRLCGQEPAVTVRFGRTAHVYDVRAQTYVARGDRVRVQIRPAEAKVYALLPYRVKALRLTAPGQVRAGEDITVRVSVDAEADTVGDHVFRIEVARPDGERVYPYCRNVFAKEGRFTDAIPFALNDATGEWRLSVRDVLTGVMAERTVRVTGR